MGIFILMGCANYEGCTPLLAFNDKADAEHWKKLAEDWDDEKPICPDCTDDNLQCIKEWDTYEALYKEWADHHPIGKGFYGDDYYSIIEIYFK